MSLQNTGSGEVSRWYVSGTKESTLGVSAATNKSFYSITNSVEQQEGQEKRKGVTGYQNAIEIVRTKLFSGGQITDNLYPAVVNWVAKMMFGAASTSAAVAPSSTVYSHTWNSITLPPSTFTMVKQLAKLAGVTELLCGLGISEIIIKSTEGACSIDIKIEGLGAGYQIGVAEPVVTPLLTADQGVLIGTASTLLIDDSEVATGLFSANWSVSIKPGFGLLATGGSADGSITRFDKNAQRSVSASLELIPVDATLLTDFKNKVPHKFEFRLTGPVIDVPNSLTSMLKLIIPKARNVNAIKTDIGNLSTFMIPLQLEGIIDTSGGAYDGLDFALVTQDLQATA